MPVNVDGSEHWDACSAAKTKQKLKSGKVYLPISSGWITGKDYVYTPCDCLPWVGCDNCLPANLPLLFIQSKL